MLLFIHIPVSCGEHELDSVYLIDLRCTRIIVDSHDVCLRICLTQMLDNTLAHDVVWKTCKWLCAHDVRSTALYELYHLTCKEPSLTVLVTNGYDWSCIGSKLFDMGRSLESLTLFKSIPCRFSEGFQNLYNSVADYGSLLGLAKELIVVIVVLEAVHEEVQEIWHNSLCSLCFQQVN